MQYSMDPGSFVIAVGALIIAILTYRRQGKLEGEQARLNKLQIEREERDAIEKNQANLNAKIMENLANESHLVISNTGRSPAYQIRLNPTKFGMLFASSDLESFPRAQLDSGETIEIRCYSDLSVTNMHIGISWSNSAGEKQQREFTLLTPKFA